MAGIKTQQIGIFIFLLQWSQAAKHLNDLVSEYDPIMEWNLKIKVILGAIGDAPQNVWASQETSDWCWTRKSNQNYAVKFSSWTKANHFICNSPLSPLLSCLPDHHQAWCYPNSAVTVLTTSISISSCKCCHFYIIFIYHQSVTLAYLEQLYLMFCSHNLPADYEHQELTFNAFQSCQWLVALYHLLKLNRVMREMLFTTSNVQYVLH